MKESLLNGKVDLHIGDCMDVLPMLADDSIDSCVTDPPYHLTSIVKRFGDEDPKKWEAIGNNHGGGVSPYHRTSKGFMGKQWDGGDVAFRPELWAQVYRVLKPGAHLLAFGGTRTYHRMACAIEDAGFEIRDCIQWLYGSGFPKSHDVSKGIDRALGQERKSIGTRESAGGRSGQTVSVGQSLINYGKQIPVNEPALLFSKCWEGWGTALKPACEPIVLARKPLSEKTVAANVLKWGTGAINVDGCRVEGIKPQVTQGINGNPTSFNVAKETRISGDPNVGRWPANVIHDGSDEVVVMFPETTSGALNVGHKRGTGINFGGGGIIDQDYGNDSGSAARFFYTAKADSDDRIGSKHPTVKPLDLMQYLVRLVTPKGGLVLDPFAGTGTTGEAAFREGMRALLIEREAEYQTDIRRRAELCMAGPDQRSYESAKAKMAGKPRDDGPLFGGSWDDMWSKPFDRPDLV